MWLKIGDMPFHHSIAHRHFVVVVPCRLIVDVAPREFTHLGCAIPHIRFHFGAYKRCLIHSKMLGDAVRSDAQGEIINALVCPAIRRGEFIVYPKGLVHTIRFFIGVGVMHHINAGAEMRVEIIHIGIPQIARSIGNVHRCLKVLIVNPLVNVHRVKSILQPVFRQSIFVG